MDKSRTIIGMEYRHPDQAFEDAIASGRLSLDPSSPIFAGNYMYMGTWGEGDGFKNIITRQYLA